MTALARETRQCDREFILGAACTLCMHVGSSAVASDTTDVQTTIRKWVHDFNAKREFMSMRKHFAFTATAALAFTACAGNALANSSKASSTKGETAASEPTNDAIVALEKSAYEAWKSKNAAFWETFLSERFVGWGMSGKLDKVSATKEYTGADCDIRSYALSDVRVSPRGKQAVLITYKATVDGTCGGQKIPANSWAA
jgi:hypothetical protein